MVINYHIWSPNQEDPPFEVDVAENETEDFTPITVEELLQAQQNYDECVQRANAVGSSGSLFLYDGQVLFCRHSPLDGAMQRVVPKGLQGRFLFLAIIRVWPVTRVAQECSKP